jgi:hypothetical protein
MLLENMRKEVAGRLSPIQNWQYEKSHFLLAARSSFQFIARLNAGAVRRRKCSARSIKRKRLVLCPPIDFRIVEGDVAAGLRAC